MAEKNFLEVVTFDTVFQEDEVTNDTRNTMIKLQ